jgi:hypothetical protein
MPPPGNHGEPLVSDDNRFRREVGEPSMLVFDRDFHFTLPLGSSAYSAEVIHVISLVCEVHVVSPDHDGEFRVEYRLDNEPGTLHLLALLPLNYIGGAVRRLEFDEWSFDGVRKIYVKFDQDPWFELADIPGDRRIVGLVFTNAAIHGADGDIVGHYSMLYCTK